MSRMAVVARIMVVLGLAGGVIKGQENARLITVTGEAEILVPPDEVVLTFGVQTKEMGLTDSNQVNDEIVQQIVNAVVDAGVKHEKVQTDHLSVEPVYGDWARADRLEGYITRRNVVVTLSDLTAFEEVLTKALEAGANRIHGVQFRTTQLRKHRDEARALAIKAAREKATDLVGALGQTLGPPRSIQELHVGSWSWYDYGWGGGGRHRAMMQNVIQSVDSPMPSTEGGIAPGQISVSARVTVSFEFAPAEGNGPKQRQQQ